MSTVYLQPGRDFGPPVVPVDHLLEEGGVLLRGAKVPAAPNNQCLVDGIFEPEIGVLHDSIFIGAVWVDHAGSHAVVPQKTPVFGDGLPFLDAGRNAVAPDGFGCTPKPLHSCLDEMEHRREGLLGSGMRIPSFGVGEDELTKFVSVRFPADGYSQRRAAGEVNLRLQTGQVLLRDECLRPHAVLFSPFLHATLERSELGHGEAFRISFHEQLQDRPRIELSVNVAFQQGHDVGIPYGGVRIDPGPLPVVFWLFLTHVP